MKDGARQFAIVCGIVIVLCVVFVIVLMQIPGPGVNEQGTTKRQPSPSRARPHADAATRFGKTETERKQIYRLLIEADDETQKQADRKYPVTGVDVKLSDATIAANERLRSQLMDERRDELAKRFGFNSIRPGDLNAEESKAIAFFVNVGEPFHRAILSAISVEGSLNKWPY